MPTHIRSLATHGGPSITITSYITGKLENFRIHKKSPVCWMMCCLGEIVNKMFFNLLLLNVKISQKNKTHDSNIACGFIAITNNSVINGFSFCLGQFTFDLIQFKLNI